MHEETNALDYSSEQEESSCDEPEECHWDLYSVYGNRSIMRTCQ